LNPPPITVSLVGIGREDGGESNSGYGPFSCGCTPWSL